MTGYLVYHPRRQRTEIGSHVVHHDSWAGNQDPYLWNSKFLHPFCHITQMRPEPGMHVFWVGGDRFPHFTKLYCDLVFVVQEKTYWREANQISPSDPLVDSPRAYKEHYQWAATQHRFKRRRRFTLKADPVKSWQPQSPAGALIDIAPTLQDLGLSLRALLARDVADGSPSTSAQAN